MSTHVKIPKFPKAVTQNEIEAQDFVIQMLKKKFLILARQERYPNTPEITQELDYIINIINELENENRENFDQE